MTKEEKLLVGEKIRALRLKAGFSQKDLAKAIGRRQSFVCEVELGKRVLSYDLMKDLARFFDVSFSYFDVEETAILPSETEQLYQKIRELETRMDRMEAKHTDKVSV